MNNLSEKPDGIEQHDEFEGVRLSWPLPSMIGRFRYMMAPFFAFGTLMWLAGLGFSCAKLVTSRFDIDMIVWILGWVVCGSWLPLMLWGLLWRRPESVLLAHDYLIHDPGRDMTSPYFLAGLLSGPPLRFPDKPITLSKAEFTLDHAEGRLFFDGEGKRREIGMSLQEAEREWLFNVLEKWRRG